MGCFDGATEEARVEAMKSMWKALLSWTSVQGAAENHPFMPPFGSCNTQRRPSCVRPLRFVSPRLFNLVAARPIDANLWVLGLPSLALQPFERQTYNRPTWGWNEGLARYETGVGRILKLLTRVTRVCVVSCREGCC